MQDLKELTKESKATNYHFQFSTPAGIQDFANEPDKQEALNKLWSENLNGFTNQGIQSNQWNTENTPIATNYFNPVNNNNAEGTPPVEVTRWRAFPGRLGFNFPNVSNDPNDEENIFKIADTGIMPGGISPDPCNSSQAADPIPYFPYGPRGWQDEYCEWAVTRNEEGKITRIDFTCENPEYWNSLWQIDPHKVLALYQSILNKPQIKLADLSLEGVIDPSTGRPVYNPLNKWNSGTISNSEKGGAIHLTSTPNTIQTEIGLGATSTVLRNNPATGNTKWKKDNDLLCFAQLGQAHRNSDPSIALAVNNFVNDKYAVTIANPPGLYMQTPDFSAYKTPDNTDAASFWTVKRGGSDIKVNGQTLSGDYFLHATFEVPADKDYTVEDIKIDNKNIKWGSQVAHTFKVRILANAYESASPNGYDKVTDIPVPQALAQPIQLFHENVFTAMYNKQIPNPVNHPISLLSNSTFIPPVISKSEVNIPLVLTVATCNTEHGHPVVTFSDENMIAEITSIDHTIEYAVPGNSSPSKYTALHITVNIANSVSEGIKNVYVTNAGQVKGPAMQALVKVTA